MGFYGNYYVNDAFLIELKEGINNLDKKIDEVDQEETSSGVYWKDKP